MEAQYEPCGEDCFGVLIDVDTCEVTACPDCGRFGLDAEARWWLRVSATAEDRKIVEQWAWGLVRDRHRLVWSIPIGTAFWARIEPDPAAERQVSRRTEAGLIRLGTGEVLVDDEEPNGWPIMLYDFEEAGPLRSV